MTETQKRIRAYKKVLPELRERVVAVALLLAMSAAMLTSASFAWLTISRRPEVTAVNTTVAANGNLEIALRQSNSEPNESAVGDSSAAKGQSVTAANITWGNLVNLSDPSYGLDNLTLRPAQLNTASLLDSPLYGAMYDADGRITQLTSNFGYATWVMPEGNKPGYFGVSDSFGVRAISSTKIEAVGADLLYATMLSKAVDTNAMAGNMYLALADDSNGYMSSLATMMGIYMTARMNSTHETLSNPDCNIADVQNLAAMYELFLKAFDKEAEAIAALINLQLFLLKGEGSYTPYDAQMVYASSANALIEMGIQVSGLDQFIKDRNLIVSDLAKLQTLGSSGQTLKWKDSGMVTIVDHLVNVGACTIGADNTPISSIGASNAMGYLSGTQEAKITNGILYRFEELTGAHIEVKNLSISATVSRSGITIPATVKANITTTASKDYYLFNNDITYAKSLNTGNFVGGIPVAQDTYGLAIDLWVRTNAEGSYLTLEGNVLLSDPVEVKVYGTDANGNQVQLYTVTLSTTDESGSTISTTVDVYPVVTKTTTTDGTETETTVWYNAENHAVMTAEEMGDEEPIAKVEEVQTVIGYEGENRVWGNNELLETDSTTQGSGSCYVYYADTPEDQARSLTLLESFKVAFVNGAGKLMATAEMDTENYYAANGRVVVPLKLSASNSINLGEDFEGKITYAITELEKNQATKITAIVYLDGTQLTNQDVLAASDIQGRLNIQFGSSQNLNPIANEELETKERRVSASVSNASFDYDKATEPMTTTVTVHVDGDAPSTVTAFFLRAISSTQGSREEPMTFTKNADGDWVADHTFTSPGNYVLRTVQLDGVDYDLASVPEVKITGFGVKSLSCEEATNNHVNVMTAANSTTVHLNLQFATSDKTKLPSTVQGRFLRADGTAVNVDFTMNAQQNWSGSATFLSSGEYTLQYLVLDGNYVELDEAIHQTASITLGMRVAVYTTSPHTFKYVPAEMAENEKLLGMQVKIMDDVGNEMPGLAGVKLTYGMKGSGIKHMDTDLTWDGSYYVGNLTTSGPGIWQFSNVTVGSNTLTNATTSPTFTIQSPEPPEYYAHNTSEYQYKPNNDAAMNAQITHSSAAEEVQAYIIKDGAAEGTWVEGTIGGELTTTDGKPANHWNFQIPKDANGYQDGNWTLTQIRMWGVFAADGSEYTQENPLVIDVSGTNNVTKVVNRVYVSFAAGQSKDFGKDADGNVTAQFMDSHTISGLNVDIKDYAGNAVPGVTDVQLTFAYQTGSSGTYGNYTSSQLNNATNGATITVALDSNSGSNYAQSQNATILYAGSYNTTLSFKVSGTTYTYTGTADDNANNTKALPANAPVFTVSSKAPVVTVTGTNPKPGTKYRFYSVSNPDSIGQLVEGDFFRYTNYTASVYLYTSISGGGRDNEAAHAYVPEVTLALSGLPAGYSNATMSFTTTNASSINSTFTFGSNATATSIVGKVTDGEESLLGGPKTFPKLYPAGKMIQNKLNLTYAGMPFEFTLANAITIDQPQSPTVLKYLGIPEEYTGTKPAQVNGNGSVITVTLPTLTWTATIEEPVDGTWSAYTSVGEVTTDENADGVPDGKVYGYRYYTTSSTVGCSTITTYHRGCQYYIWTKFQSSCTAVTNIYTQEKQIVQWIINGKTYDAGTTIQLNGEGIITATAVVSDAGEMIFVKKQEQTSYKYLYGYLPGDSKGIEDSLSGFNDAYEGTQIGSTVNNSSGVLPAAKVAVASTADAATDTPGTNMTTDSAAYEQYWP